MKIGDSMLKIDKNTFNDEKLKKEAEENLDIFLERYSQSLTTFTREPGLRYLASPNLEKFVLKPRENILYLPLSTFLASDLDNNEILWHIYYELALYPDWLKNTSYYLARSKTWKSEIDEVGYYIYKKVNQILPDNNIEMNFIRQYVKNEILDFLFQMDKYYSYLRVMETCPMYRDQEEKIKIIEYIKTRNDREEITSALSHHFFAKSFLLRDIYRDDESLTNKLEEKFDIKVFSEPIYVFLKKEFLKEINRDDGITSRDPLIKAFIYPSFKKYWLEEVDSMEAKDSGDDGRKFFEESQKEESEDKLESTRKDVETSLEEIIDQESSKASSNKDSNSFKVENYDISREEVDLFNYYANKTNAQREEMKNFWKKLIGSAKKEVSVEKIDKPKEN